MRYITTMLENLTTTLPSGGVVGVYGAKEPKMEQKKRIFRKRLVYSKLECTSTYYPKREPFEGTVARLCE